MFKEVLVGIDGTPHGRDAIALARQLTDAQAQLTLVHVHWRRLWSGRPVAADYFEAETAHSWHLLEREKEASGISAELASVFATSPGRGLHLEAEQRQADRIVVGSSRRGFLGRAVLGDDARAGDQRRKPRRGDRTARLCRRAATALDGIGVAYNGTPESDAALAAARGIATRTDAALSALDVVLLPALAYAYTTDRSRYMREEIDAARGVLEGIPDVAGRTVCGLPGEELARFSGELDLLAVGSRGYGPLRDAACSGAPRTTSHATRVRPFSCCRAPRSTASSPSPSRGQAPERGPLAVSNQPALECVRHKLRPR